MMAKPIIDPDDPFAFELRPEDVEEFLRIQAADPFDPRLWTMTHPALGYEDDGQPEPKPDEQPPRS
jgi:hypothetical protein